MTRPLLLLGVLCCIAVTSSCQRGTTSLTKKELPKELKEISGITAVGDAVWSISDNPRQGMYRLSTSGDVIQKVNITNASASDVEAITSDNAYLYIGDLGDNNGKRLERKIFKVPLSGLTDGREINVSSEEIQFAFPGEGEITKKKNNNFDCESLVSYRDSLYVFTKDREDRETRLYSLSKAPGRYTARYISSFDSKGLITDAAVNAGSSELALLGYRKGHREPFVIILTNFKGNDFFSGRQQRIGLGGKKLDWQLEGITYGRDGLLYLSCEETRDVPATFYAVKKENLADLEK